MSIYNNKTGEEKLKGMILKVWGTFQMDMSFDEVLYWCETDQRSKTTRVCGDWWAKTDATEEIKQKYIAEIERAIKKSEKDYEEQEKRIVKVGSTVKVVRGRKLKKGTVFRVKEIRKFQFGTMLFDYNGDHTYLRNVMVDSGNKFVNPIEKAIKRTVYFRAI